MIFGWPKNSSNFRRYRNSSQCGAATTSRGFTLIELMIVLAILGVILAFALPGFSNVGLVTRIKAHTNEFVGDVYLAKSEAVKRNSAVRLCIANAAADDCKDSGNWDDGWLVIDPNDVVIKHRGEVAGKVMMVSLSGVHTYTFDPTGAGVQSTSSGGTVTALSQIRVCQSDPVGHQERDITLTTNGRTRVEVKYAGVCPGS